MSEEKRRAGDYEIIQAVQIGDCEIVVGENMADENDLPYMVAYYEYNAIMGRYFEAVGSGDLRTTHYGAGTETPCGSVQAENTGY